MGDFHNQMTVAFRHNLEIFLRGESWRPNDNYISLDEFNNFLHRFGPLDIARIKINKFIEHGARNWFHGNISRDNASHLLEQQFRTHYLPEAPQTLYLVRNVEIQKGIDHTLYVFAITWCNRENLHRKSAKQQPPQEHFRIFINQEHELCFVEKKDDRKYMVDVSRWDINQILQKLAVQMKLNFEDFVPVRSLAFSGLLLDPVQLIPENSDVPPLHPENCSYFEMQPSPPLIQEQIIYEYPAPLPVAREEVASEQTDIFDPYTECETNLTQSGSESLDILQQFLNSAAEF